MKKKELKIFIFKMKKKYITIKSLIILNYKLYVNNKSKNKLLIFLIPIYVIFIKIFQNYKKKTFLFKILSKDSNIFFEQSMIRLFITLKSSTESKI